MAKPKPTFCNNCGKGVNCKTFNRTGKACRKGKAKGKAVGKAVGKAKGKAISQKTIDKRDEYDSRIGDLHTDYLNHMRNKQIKTIVDEETGEIIAKETFGKVYSFERYLKLRGEHTLASWFRYNYKDIDSFNFND